MNKIKLTAMMPIATPDFSLILVIKDMIRAVVGRFYKTLKVNPLRRIFPKMRVPRILGTAKIAKEGKRRRGKENVQCSMFNTQCSMRKEKTFNIEH
jgi:hypothetical protein